MNDENLIPMNKRSKSEQRKIQQMGGKASAKARAERAEIKKVLPDLLSLPLHKGKLDDITSIDGIDTKNITVLEAMVLKQIQQAIKRGDLKAFRELVKMLRECSGQAEEEQAQTQNTFIQALEGKAAEVFNDEK